MLVRFIQCFLALAFLMNCLWANAQFQRAMVFPGGGFQPATFMGILEAFEKNDLAPDVFIGACGGSIAATLAANVHDSDERKKIVESRYFYNFLKNFHFKQGLDGQADDAGIRLIELFSTHWTAWMDKIPNFFDQYLMEPPAFDFYPYDQKFPEGERRLIVVAGQMLFGPEDVGRDSRNRRLYREVYFTDSMTARRIEGFQSPIARRSEGRVLENTDVYLGYRASEAVRASITDPTLFEPKMIHHSYMMGGVIDLYPLELARYIAQESVMVFTSGGDSLVIDPTVYSAFGYHFNDRIKEVHAQYSDYWVDLSDNEEMYGKFGFNPRLILDQSLLKNWKLIKRQIPEKYEIFLSKIRQQWDYGYQRGLEAVMQIKKNSKSHIRRKDTKNWSPELESSS